MMKNVLILMVGIPGSGKTTIAKRRASDRDIYISRDEIRFSLLNDGEDYFSKENLVLKTFIKKINQAIESDKYRFIFADATHLNRNSRQKILTHLVTKPATIFAMYVDTPLEVAIARNEKRIGRAYVPPKQIKKMYNSIETPTKQEGIDVVFILDENGNLDFQKSLKVERGEI